MEKFPASIDGIQPPIKPLSEVVQIEKVRSESRWQERTSKPTTSDKPSIEAVRKGSRWQERTPKPTTQDRPKWLEDFLVGKDLKRGLDATEPIPEAEETIEPERLPIKEQKFQGNTGGGESVEEKEVVTAEVKEVNEEPLPEELIDQAREEAKKIKETKEEKEKENTETFREEPERLSVEEQMLQVHDGASPEFEETSASGATTEGLQESEEAVVHESEKNVRDEAWKESREQYMAYRREVIKAKKTFLEKSEAYEKERRSTGVLARLMATPKLAETKEEMLDAQRAYDEKLDEWRDRRGGIVGNFIERQKQRKETSQNQDEKARIDKKNEERGEGYVNYFARREAILEHQINNEVSTLENLRYQENGNDALRYKAVRAAKVIGSYWGKIPKAGRVAFGVGLGVAFTGAAIAGVAARKLVGVYAGGWAALKTKKLGDEWAEAKGEQALKKQHEAFADEKLSTSREARMKIRRNVRTRKHVATVAAAGAAWAVGASAADVIDPLSLDNGTLSSAHAGTLTTNTHMPESGDVAIFPKTETPSTNTHMPESGDVATFDSVEESSLVIPKNTHMPESGDIATFPEKVTPPINSHMPESGDVAVFPDTHRPESGDIAVFPQEEIRKYNSVEEASLGTKPEITELLKKLGIGEEVSTDKQGPLLKGVPPSSNPHMPESGDVAVFPNTHMPESGDIAVFPKTETPPINTHMPESGDIANFREKVTPPINSHMPESGDVAVFPNTHMPESGDVAVFPEGQTVDTHMPESGDVATFAEKETPHEIPKDVNVAPVEPTPDIYKLIPEKGIALEGVYEAGSSVQGELQDFLENDTWVKETYPNLTDVERGKIAHLIQQEIAKDPEMMKSFNIKGDDWHKVKVNSTYEVTLDKDLLINEIEKVHVPKSVPAEVTPPLEKPPVSNLPLEQDATKLEVKSAVETTKHVSASEVKDVPVHTKEVPPMSIKEDLAHAKEVIGPDYLGASTRPALADLFKEGYFQGSVLQGQRSLIMSYWGPMSHVRMEDIFDKSRSLTYTIDNKPPVTMGAGVEALTYNLVDKLEHSLRGKIPNVADIIEQSRTNNETLGELINKLHLQLEEVESFRPKFVAPPDNLPTAPKLAPESVPAPDIVGTPPSDVTQVPEGKATLPQIDAIPLDKYVAPEVVESGTRAVAKLPYIEVTPEISKLVDVKYHMKEPAWQDLTAGKFYKLNDGFRGLVDAQLTDIAVVLKGTSVTPLDAYSFDWSAYEGMKPRDVMLQLEQHEAMLKKLHQDMPQGEVIETKKF